MPRSVAALWGETRFHVTYVWAKLGEFAASLTKGAHLQVEGEIRTREYTEKTGAGKKSAEVKKTITEVRATSISKLDRAKGETEGAAA